MLPVSTGRISMWKTTTMNANAAMAAVRMAAPTVISPTRTRWIPAEVPSAKYVTHATSASRGPILSTLSPTVAQHLVRRREPSFGEATQADDNLSDAATC